ncbi:3D domain-containing protein [Solibacillus isronensis]|uniref:3D domain-containing protein n=1 Tax=Solibacillus isronensis TaxID=412383 RepID=UPI0020403876|nr:3D domain-containing protein [Solibacillus isronensis]MCM3721764.1 3D domain-containing protein [Solibacillus isronensis]
MIKKLVAFIAVMIASTFIFAGTSEAASHTIKKGENLTMLAKKYDTSVKELMALNDLKTTKVQVKQVLKLPSHIKNKTAVKKSATTTKKSATHPSNVKKTIKMSATAYTANCKGCSGITKTGLNLRKNPSLKVIAVDPKIIPLGSKVWVEGYGIAVAGDIGSAIKGKKIDLFMSKKSTAKNWGRKTVTVKLLKS